MAEYAPLHDPGDAFTRQASASITGGQLLIVSGSGTVAPSTAATAAWIGVAAFDAASGDNVTVIAEAVHKLTAVGSITAGNTVEAAAGGGVATHANGTNDANVVGVALTSATNGNVVEVLIR